MTDPRSLLATDIEENFLRCSICLEIFTDPRLLPCHHRYCKECLIKTINTNIKGNLKCPLCQQKYQIPENGVDGFKSDFHMNSLLQFINLQKSFKKKEIRECIGCSKQLEVSAYCFKCKDFLCEECFKSHLKSRLLKDHWEKVLSLKDFESQNLTAKDLANLTEAPRCNKHLERESVICCESCGNLPICMVCATPDIGDHCKPKHKVQDVKVLAKTERERVEVLLTRLKKYEVDVLKLKDKVAVVRKNLTQTITDQKSQLTSQIKKSEQKISKLMTKNCDECNEHIEEIQQATQTKLDEIKSERQQEIDRVLEQINTKYDEKEKVIREACDRQTRTNIQLREKRETKCREDMSRLHTEFLDLKFSIESKGTKNIVELEVVSGEIENTIKHLQNVMSTTDMVLAANNDWMMVQCLPSIREACDPLVKKLKKKYPTLDTLSDVPKCVSQSPLTNDYTFQEGSGEVIPLTIKDIGKCEIDFVTVSEDGHIFVFYSDMGEDVKHLVLGKEGEMLSSVRNFGLFPLGTQLRAMWRATQYDSTVAVACSPSEVRIYEASNSTFRFRNLSVAMESYPVDRLVTWACIDRATKEICVATNSRTLYILNRRLEFSRSVTLPAEVGRPRHITINGNALFVCDAEHDNAYVININFYQGQVYCKLSKPSAESHTNFTPLSIVIDSKETIYVLWAEVPFGQIQIAAFILHYSSEGILLESRPAPRYAKSMALQTTDDKELLVVVSTMQKLYLYELVEVTK